VSRGRGKYLVYGMMLSPRAEKGGWNIGFQPVRPTGVSPVEFKSELKDRWPHRLKAYVPRLGMTRCELDN
jgi:hypothetical protein